MKNTSGIYHAKGRRPVSLLWCLIDNEPISLTIYPHGQSSRLVIFEHGKRSREISSYDNTIRRFQ